MKNSMVRALARILLALVLLFAPHVARAQDFISKPYSYLSTASTNSTLIYNDRALLKLIIAVNTTATTYYLKLYSKATAPTCGTDTPTFRIPLPPQSTGGGVVAIDGASAQFPSGIGFCLTGGLADSDSTNAATGVALNFAVIWQ